MTDKDKWEYQTDGPKRKLPTFLVVILALAIVFAVMANWNIIGLWVEKNTVTEMVQPSASDTLVADGGYGRPEAIEGGSQPESTGNYEQPEVVSSSSNTSATADPSGGKPAVVPREKMVLAPKTEPDTPLSGEYADQGEDFATAKTCPRIKYTDYTVETVKEGGTTQTSRRSNNSGIVEAFSKGGKIGFKFGEDWGGDVIIEPEYDRFRYYIQTNNGGVAVVQKGGKWGVVGMNNKIVVPFEYDRIDYYAMRWLVLRDGKYGYLQENGDISIPVEYDYIGRTSKSNTFKVKKDGKYGFMTIEAFKGKIIIPVEYAYAYDNCFEYYHVRRADSTHVLFNLRGRQFDDATTQEKLRKR